MVSSHADSNESIIVSFDKEKNLLVGSTLFVPTPQNSSGKITAYFRDEKFNFISITKSFFSNEGWSNVSFSFEEPFQNFLNSFVLHSVHLNFSNNNTREFKLNKIVNFKDLNVASLGEDVFVKNITYIESTGEVILDVILISNKGSQFVEFFIRDLETGAILIKKERPVSKGNNTISFFIPSNLNKFFVEVDSSRKIFEYSEANNVVFYPFSKKEFCGDQIDNNDNFLIDENCYSKCPDSLSLNSSWHIVTCKNKYDWNSKMLDSLSNYSFPKYSNISIKRKFDSKTKLRVISSMPLQITGDEKIVNVCSNKLFERSIVVEENDSIEIFFKSTNNSLFKLISTPLQ